MRTRTPFVSFFARVSLETEATRRKLEERLKIGASELLARSLAALEEKLDQLEPAE